MPDIDLQAPRLALYARRHSAVTVPFVDCTLETGPPTEHGATKTLIVSSGRTPTIIDEGLARIRSAPDPRDQGTSAPRLTVLAGLLARKPPSASWEVAAAFPNPTWPGMERRTTDDRFQPRFTADLPSRHQTVMAAR